MTEKQCSSEVMNKICDVSDLCLEAMTDSLFIKPHRLKYIQNGKPKVWDLITCHESVAIVIYNTDRKKLVFVKQFRPAVYFNSLPKCEVNKLGKLNTDGFPISMGVTMEWCAGIVDKKEKIEVIAQAEVLEECGYDVPLHKFEKIKTHRSGIGTSGEKQTMFYVEVTDAMKVTEGGGLASEDELIEVAELSLQEMEEILHQSEVNCPGAFLFALLWFKCNKL